MEYRPGLLQVVKAQRFDDQRGQVAGLRSGLSRAQVAPRADRFDGSRPVAQRPGDLADLLTRAGLAAVITARFKLAVKVGLKRLGQSDS